MKALRDSPAKVVALILGYVAIGVCLVAAGGEAWETAGILVCCFTASLIALRGESGGCGRFGRR